MTTTKQVRKIRSAPWAIVLLLTVGCGHMTSVPLVSSIGDKTGSSDQSKPEVEAITKDHKKSKLVSPAGAAYAASGRELLKKRDKKGYVRSLLVSYSIDKNDKFVPLELAQFYYFARDYKSALPFYRDVTQSNPKINSSMESDPRCLAPYGEWELLFGDKEAGVDAIHRAQAAYNIRYPKLGGIEARFGNTVRELRAQSHYLVGRILQSGGQVDRARSELLESVTLAPNNQEVKLILATDLDRTLPYRSEEALKLYKTIANSKNREIAKEAEIAEKRLERYKKIHGSFDPIDPKTGKKMIWNPETHRYEVAAG